MSAIQEALTANPSSLVFPASAHGKATHAAFSLVIMNISDPDQRAELKTQRISCGWNHSDDTLDKWRDLSTVPEDKPYAPKTFFWIVLADGTRAGHVCLDRDPHLHPAAGNAVDDGRVEEIRDSADARSVAAIPVEKTVRVTVLHILSAHQGRGLANATMDALEAMATRPPYGFADCEAVDLDTLDRRYLTQEGRDWMGIWERMGVDTGGRRGRIVMDWYVWRGYVPYRREEKYVQRLRDGVDWKLWGVVMRKRVGKGMERRANGSV